MNLNVDGIFDYSQVLRGNMLYTFRCSTVAAGVMLGIANASADTLNLVCSSPHGLMDEFAIDRQAKRGVYQGRTPLRDVEITGQFIRFKFDRRNSRGVSDSISYEINRSTGEASVFENRALLLYISCREPSPRF